jgi:hypothetical protein
MLNRRSRLACFALFTAVSLTLPAAAELKSIGSAQVEMHLPGGTAGLSIDGKSSKLSVAEAGGVVTVRARLDCMSEEKEHTSCIKTGIAMRDKHLWKQVEADKHPDAALSVERKLLKIPNDNDKSEGDATGTFSLHGVKKQLSFHYAAHRTGSDIHVQGHLKFNLKDFNIERPSFSGVHTGTVAEIKVQFKLRE